MDGNPKEKDSFTFYRIEYPDRHFYIGSTTNKNIEGYLKEKHKYLSKRNSLDFSFEDMKIEAKTDFSSEQELKDFEHQEIKRYIRKTSLCLNQYLETNCQKEISSKYTCKECGGKNNRHFKSCSKYIQPDSCPECGGSYQHRKGCSKYKEPEICSECNGKRGKHYKGCSKAKTCLECNGTNGNHKKFCSKYKEPAICPECKGKYNHHKDSCSKSKGKCQYCGYSLQSHRHAKDCPLYRGIKNSKSCPECGGKHYAHKRTCSKYRQPTECLECGGKRGNHRKGCSKYKRKNRI